jgi:oxygen-independent coproporphyrinogen III oxidase
MHPYSLYVHIPFCRHRCSYCDFNTYAGMENLIPDYIRALSREIELLANSAGSRLPVHTVFFGGGTPSLLPAAGLARLIVSLEEAFDLRPDLEITLEANPGELSYGYLLELRAIGINRLSLGMQSADPRELDLLEREHTYNDVVKSVEAARSAGFNNLSLDLIFGLPYQTRWSWRKSLDKAIALQPDHLSLYALTLEHGTPLQHRVSKGLVPEPDPDLAADMYEHSSSRLAEAGFIQYEISNWGRRYGNGDILASRHNLQYWRNHPYLGFGAGAHGFAGGMRTANVLAPSAYISRLSNGRRESFPCTPATVSTTPVGPQEEMAETMMMGLRLTMEGVSNQQFTSRFGTTLQEKYGKEISRLTELGLLEWGGNNGECLRLTSKGRLLGNQVFLEFI